MIADFLPDTHSFHHFPRCEGRGGGVGVIMSKAFERLKATRRPFSTFECLQISFEVNKKPFNLFSIYRPPAPTASFFPEFEQFLLDSQSGFQNTLYVGDFNIWVEDVDNVVARHFLRILNDFSLKNFINCATFDSGHILDLVISSANSEFLSDFFVEPVCTISDHRLVSFSMNVPFCSKQSKTIKFRRRTDSISERICDKMVSLSLDIDSEACPHSLDNHCVKCSTDKFRNVASEIYEECAPVIEKTIKVTDSSNLWYNAEIRDAKKKCRKVENLYKRRKCAFTRNKFVRVRQEKNDVIRRAKKNYFSNKIECCSSDPKKLFCQLNKLLGKNIMDNSRLPVHVSKHCLANKFKTFFISKIERIILSFSPAQQEIASLIPDFPLIEFENFIPISTERVSTCIANMNKTHCLNDPIDIKLINFEVAGGHLSEVFCKIINKSFESGCFPSSEKFSYVRPLLKANKDPDDISSYRPLYNTSFLSKLLEYSALDQLKKHLSRFQFFPICQSAYRQGHSVETAMCKIYNDLVVSKSKGECSILILLDLSAAFDTVDHGLLLNDLKLLGLGGNVLKWFESYLRDRRFKVVIGEEVSEEGTMTSGVPQGSVLGPILFTIYTAELSFLLENLGVSFHFYADDTQIYFKITDIREDKIKIDRVIQNVKNWMTGKKLKLNSDKTEIMIVGSSSQLNRLECTEYLTLDNSEIKLSDSVRSLGVILDKNLSMKCQLKRVKSKAICNLINIARISIYLDRAARMKLVHGLILSHIDFCNSLLYGLPDYELRTLQMIINSATRVVVGMPRFSREHITPCCIDLHILPIKARIIYKICLLTHKALIYEQPRYLLDLLHRREGLQSLRSTTVRALDEPIVSQLASSNRCFSYCAPKLYNSLPAEIQNITSIVTFKKRLKTYIFCQAYDLENKCVRTSFTV